MRREAREDEGRAKGLGIEGGGQERRTREKAGTRLGRGLGARPLGVF